MENRVSYILIGLFVFILGISTVSFVLWLGKYAGSEAYSFYKVITQESVSGLNPKAPVKLRGVIVGEVKDIYISRENSEDVVILIQVKEGTPIKEDTYGLINLQGITGLSYVELQGGGNESKLLKTGSKEDAYGVIKTKSSMLTRVDRTITDIGEKTSTMLDKTISAMNEENLKNFELILKNLVEVTSSLNTSIKMVHSKSTQLDSVLSGAHEFEVSATKAADEVKIMARDLRRSGLSTLESMSSAAATTSRVMNALDKKLKDGNLDLDILLRENLLPFQNDLEDLRTLIAQSRELMSELKDSPSDLLFKETNIEPAPNEEYKQ